MKAWNCSLSTTTNVVVVGLFIMVCMLIMWFSFKKSRNQQYEDFTFILLHYKNWPLIVMFSAKNHGKHDWKINKIVKSKRKNQENQEKRKRKTGKNRKKNPQKKKWKNRTKLSRNLPLCSVRHSQIFLRRCIF